jgi:ribosomal protein L22
MASAPPETQTVRAQAKWVRMSARKGRVVAEHIRGRSVPEARAVLAFTSRAAAREIEKVLASAVANAEANHGLSGDELIVHAAVVDEGPTLKRWRARARGRVARIKKRTCHITLTLAPGEVEVAPPPRPKKTEAPAQVEEAQPVAEETGETTPETTESKPRRTAKPKAAAEPETDAAAKPKRSPRRKKTEEAES